VVSAARGRIAAVAAAVIAGAVAWLARGTIAGGAAWLVVLAIASGGVGVAIERLTRRRATAALTVATGLAGLLVISTLLAQLGVLGSSVQLALVIGGVALIALPRRESPRVDGADRAAEVAADRAAEPAADRAAEPPADRAAEPPADRAAEPPADDLRVIDLAAPDTGFRVAFGSTAAFVVIVLGLVAAPPALDDNASHAFAIKRLWDLGALAGGWYQRGLSIVGESFAAWPIGAHAASVFHGLCAALVAFVVAGEVRAHDARSTRLWLALLLIAIALRPAAMSDWPAVLFHLTAILSLRGAIAARRIAWPTLIAAAALALVRDEYALLAVPYAIAAIAAPAIDRPAPRWIALALAAWWLSAFAVLVGIRVPVGIAIAKAIPLLGALPLGALLFHLLGGGAWRSSAAAACVAVAGYQLALAVYAVSPTVHVPEATFAAWFALGVAILVEMPGRRAAPLAIAVIALTLLVLPMYRTGELVQLGARISGAVTVWRERTVFGVDRDGADVRAAQEKIPAGAAIAYWGREAARLDFRRNPIRDISRIAGKPGPIRAASLHGAAWLIVEEREADRRRDPWLGTQMVTPAIAPIRDVVALHASAGIARVYRVTSSPP
jgi:hypothetical protein